MDFCNFISNMTNIGRFIAFATMRYRREKRRVGFDENSVKGNLSNDFALFVRSFISHGTCDSEVKVERKRFLGGFEITIKRMEHAGPFSKRAAQSTRPLAQNRKQVDRGIPRPGIAFLAHVNDYGLPHFLREMQLPFEQDSQPAA